MRREELLSVGGAEKAGHRLEFPQLERSVEYAEGESLYHCARRHGVRIVGACGGRGTCGSCMVRVREGAAMSLNRQDVAADAQATDSREHAANRRKWLRACQIGAQSDCVIEIAPRSLAPVVRMEAERVEGEPLALDAAVRAFEGVIPVPTLEDDRADVDRVLGAFGCDEAEIGIDAAAELAGLLRQAQGPHIRLRAWRRSNELIAFGPCGRRSLGLAVDLGTTNVAAFLIDLESGEELARLGVENPQTAWGADLISRINHAMTDEKTALRLRKAALEAINALAHDLCFSIGHKRGDIVDVAICGNTAMHHLLLGLPVRQLGRAPFVAVLRERIDVRARELGLAVAAGAWVHVAPNIGGFIGGDHVAALLATEGLWRDSPCALVMDIGTNTEISLIHRGRLYSASSPSGPALEGGHISCGMRAAEGAIEKVTIESGRLTVRTIGDIPAVGLCGSGVLDTLAVLRRGGWVNAGGRLCTGHEDIVASESGQRAVRLASGVLFTQEDIRSVQLAKAAIRTSTELLLAEAGLRAEAIERFIIAGSFGAYIDVASGIEIGLFPPLTRERFHQVGNAAGLGVRRLLASRADREHARALARRARALALNSLPDFQKMFLRNIGFDPAVS